MCHDRFQSLLASCIVATEAGAIACASAIDCSGKSSIAGEAPG